MNVKKLTYEKLCEYIGKTVILKSDCEFFPHFTVIGRVIDIKVQNNEYIINIKTKPNNKELSIGSNMKNLTITKMTV